MTFKRDWVNNSIMSGRSPPLYCLYTYINRHAGTPDRHRKQNKTVNNVVPVGAIWVQPVINVGEKPTVILYTYINRHAEPPKENITNISHCSSSYRYDNRSIAPSKKNSTGGGLGQHNCQDPWYTWYCFIQ